MKQRKSINPKRPFFFLKSSRKEQMRFFVDQSLDDWFCNADTSSSARFSVHQLHRMENYQ